jgi:hypothetical protein
MGSLLDQLFGAGPNDPRSAPLGLLYGNMAAGNTPRGLLAANQAFAQAPMDAMKQRLMEAQLAETLAQADERKISAAARAKKMEYVNNWMNQLDNSAPQANAAVLGQTGNLSPTRANASLQNDAMASINASNPLVGIPRQAIMGDLAMNEGKSIPEWMFKRGIPDMQNINGVWVDKNRAQAGQSLPQMSPTGQGYQLVPDPSAPGGYRVTTPAGSLDTYRQFKQADADIAAGNELVTVDLPGGPRQMTKAQALQLVGGQTTPRAASRAPAMNIGGGQALTPQLRAAIEQDARTNGITSPQTAFVGAKPGQAYGLQPSGVAQAPAGSDGPGVALKAKPTRGQEALDAEFAKAHAEFAAGGGFADVQKQLVQLEEAASKLTAGSGVTGPLVGMMPDKLRAMTSPGAADVMEQVLETAQRNLRVVLGPQFTAKEGEALLARVYNPLLPPEVNQTRVNRLITQIRKAAEAKADAGRYFEERGTLTGWGGKLPTFADFEPASRAASGKTGSAPPAPAPGMVRGGYRFKGGDPADRNSWEKQ